MSSNENSDPAQIGMRIRGANGQTANLFVVEVYGGTDKFVIDSDGDVTVSGNFTLTGSLAYTGEMQITGDTAATITLKVSGASGQSADLFVVEQNDGTDVFKVDKDGYITKQFDPDVSNYTIWGSGGAYYAKNGATGMVDYSDASAVVVFQAVCDALTSGGTVYVKRGTYIFATTLDIDGATKPTIVGEGHTTILQAGGDFPLINVAGGTQGGYEKVLLSDLSLLGGGYASTLLYFGNQTFGQRINRVYFDSTTNYAVHFYMTATPPNNIRFTDCSFATCGDASHSVVYATSYADHILFRGCVFGGLATGQTRIIDGLYRNFRFFGNHVECGTNTATFIHLGGYGAQIADNLFVNADVAIHFYNGAVRAKVTGNEFMTNTTDIKFFIEGGGGYSACGIISGNGFYNFTNGVQIGDIATTATDGWGTMCVGNTFNTAKVSTATCFSLYTVSVSLIGNTAYAVTAAAFADGYNNKGVVMGNHVGGFTTLDYFIKTRGYGVKWLVSGNSVNATLSSGFTDTLADLRLGPQAAYITENSGTSTGTGAQQTIAHGLSTTPTRVFLSESTTGGALAYQSAAADATNIYITATNAKTYQWEAKVV